MDAVLPVELPHTGLAAVMVQSGRAVMDMPLVQVLEHPNLETVTLRVVVPEEPAV